MLTWLHLSDIHSFYKNHTNEHIKDTLIDYLKTLDKKFNIVIITGDIAYQGKYSTDLKEFIVKLSKATGCELDKFFVCIGNHDFERGKQRTNSVKVAVDDYKKDEIISEENYRYIFEAGHQLFNNKMMEFFPDLKELSEPHHFKTNEKYSVTTFNTCLFSCNDKDENNLYINDNKFYNVLKHYKEQRTEDKINLAIGHHSYEWLNPEQRKEFAHYMEDSKIDLYLCGHNHNFDTKEIEDTKIRQFVAGSIFSTSNEKVCFLIGTFDQSNKMYSMEVHSFASDSGEWSKENNVNRLFKNGIFTDKLARTEIQKIKKSNVKQNMNDSKMIEFEMGLLGIQQKVSDFIGYENELKVAKESIMDIQQKQNHGDYLFYQARELYGKSYFCSKLVHDLCFDDKSNRLELEKNGVIFIDGKTVNNSSRTIELISAQANNILGYEIEFENENITDDRKTSIPISDEKKVFKIIRELSNHDKKILLVIDALNEISSEPVQFLPEVLPQGICILVTSNNKTSMKNIIKVRSKNLSGFTNTEIKQVLKCNDSKFVDKVFKITKGCPKLIFDVAESLRKVNGETDKIKIKSNGKEYFRDKISEWKSNEILTKLMDLFGVFGYVSFLTIDQLYSYVTTLFPTFNVNSEDIVDALENIRNQLSIYEGDESPKYKIYYSLFADRITTRGTKKESEGRLKRISEWIIANIEEFDDAVLGQFFVYWINKIEDKREKNDFLLKILIKLMDMNKKKTLFEIAAILFINRKKINNCTLDFFETHVNKLDEEKIYIILLDVYEKNTMGYSSIEKMNELLMKMSNNDKYLWAKVELGIRLLDGKNIKQNKEKGEKLLRETAEQGNIEAKGVLGTLLLDGKNIKQNKEEGEKFLREICEQGDGEAKKTLGIRLLDGNTIKQNKEEGEKLLREAAEQGNIQAKRLLGTRLLDGKNIKKNKKEGEKLLREVAEQGNIEAKKVLGIR
ncbi:metallophosphoesterase, partial [Lutibacter sp. B2]|nr:metallophosphoesterase [Lutibacter sp. B2]